MFALISASLSTLSAECSIINAVHVQEWRSWAIAIRVIGPFFTLPCGPTLCFEDKALPNYWCELGAFGL